MRWLDRKQLDRKVSEGLNVSQECTLAAKRDNCNLGCVSRSVVSKSRKAILWLAVVRLHFKCCAQFWALQHREDTGALSGSSKGHQVVEGDGAHGVQGEAVRSFKP